MKAYKRSKGVEVGTAALLNRGTTWKGVFSFTFRPLYVGESARVVYSYQD